MTGSPPLTAESLRLAAAARLRDAGIPTPALDARLLVEEMFRQVLQAPPGDLTWWSEATVPRADEVRAGALLAELLRRRLGGEPVSRIVGEREFWSLRLSLSAATLDPRPDTETVVEAALGEAGRLTRRPVIADLGTGTGAILLALLRELPAAVGVGIDLAEEAARTARDNARRLGLAARAQFVVGRWGEALGNGAIDLLVTNPPYIRSGEIESLPRDVRDHDPWLALDGGEDGLDAYRAIIADLPRLLAPDGAAVLELGTGQSGDVAKLAARFGFSAAVRRDLAGHDRAMTLRR